MTARYISCAAIIRVYTIIYVYSLNLDKEQFFMLLAVASENYTTAWSVE